MRACLAVAVLILLAATAPVRAAAQDSTAIEPRAHVYRTIGRDTLMAYVFAPASFVKGELPHAILLFHGGGWSSGAPEWTFDAARRFAGWGMVAVSVQYRLSAGNVTPIDALDDACAAFRWAREHGKELGIGGRLVGYGVSAGGHLVAMAATAGCPERGPKPEALLLWSPALDLAHDGWFAKKLQGRAPVAEYSPVEFAGASTPPTSIVHGAKDTLTPLAGATRFCERVVAAGGVCELNVYEGVGHLLTRNLGNQESNFDPDPEARAAGIAQQRRFLKRLGLIADK